MGVLVYFNSRISVKYGYARFFQQPYICISMQLQISMQIWIAVISAGHLPLK